MFPLITQQLLKILQFFFSFFLLIIFFLSFFPVLQDEELRSDFVSIVGPRTCNLFFSAHRGLFVCIEVLRPSQPNGVMSSAVSLPNHTFTGQA